MDPFEFHCPYCVSPLRIRDKVYVGRPIDCPACHQPLTIVATLQGLAVDRAAPPPSSEPARATPQSWRAACSARLGSLVARARNSRRALVALLIVALGVVCGTLLRPPESSAPPALTDDPAADPAAPLDVPLAPDVGPPAVAVVPGNAADPDPDVALVDLLGDDSPVDGPSGDSEPGAGPEMAEPDPDLAEEEPADDLPARPAPAEEPLDPEFAAEPPFPFRTPREIQAALRQPILRFEQPRTKPLIDVVTAVAELAGARVTYRLSDLGPAVDRLAEPVALQLAETTVGEILGALLTPAGLAYRIEGASLRLIPRARE